MDIVGSSDVSTVALNVSWKHGHSMMLPLNCGSSSLGSFTVESPLDASLASLAIELPQLAVELFMDSGYLSFNRVYTWHFKGLNVVACGFSVIIFHFEGIRSLILAGFSGFIYLCKILN